MAISFVCSCGKKMAAKDEFAGRRLRCPECQCVVTIPKAGSGQIATPRLPAQKSSGTFGLGSTLTTSEAAGLDVTRPTHETPSPSRTLPNDFADEPPATPAPTAIPFAPVAEPVGSLSKTPVVTSRPVHPWVDLSFQQSITPWRFGDEETYQANVRPARERDNPLAWLTPMIAGAAAVYFLVFAG